MPAVSRKQLRLMEMIAHGGHNPTNMSREQAKEYVSHNTGKYAMKNLPEEKYSKLRKMMRGGRT